MKRMSETELGSHLAKYMDEVCETNVPLYVSRGSGGAVVILSGHEYGGMMETLHLLANPTNSIRLLESVADADAGRLIEREI
jgi:antitoxin YefM